MVNRVGLCYSELVTLKKLWGSANQLQKEIIKGENLQNSSIYALETKGCQNSPKKEIFTNKLGETHIKKAFP